jgi:hypothetical protein
VGTANPSTDRLAQLWQPISEKTSSSWGAENLVTLAYAACQARASSTARKVAGSGRIR